MTHSFRYDGLISCLAGMTASSLVKHDAGKTRSVPGKANGTLTVGHTSLRGRWLTAQCRAGSSRPVRQPLGSALPEPPWFSVAGAARARQHGPQVTDAAASAVAAGARPHPECAVAEKARNSRKTSWAVRPSGEQLGPVIKVRPRSSALAAGTSAVACRPRATRHRPGCLVGVVERGDLVRPRLPACLRRSAQIRHDFRPSSL